MARKKQGITTDKAIQNLKNSKSGKGLYDKVFKSMQAKFGPAFTEADLDDHIKSELKGRYSSKTEATDDIKFVLNQINKTAAEHELSKAKREAKSTATFDLRTLNRKNPAFTTADKDIDPTDLIQTANASEVKLAGYYKFDGTDIVLLCLTVTMAHGSPIQTWVYASAGLLAKYGIK